MSGRVSPPRDMRCGTKLDQRVKGWAYQLGGWKSASLVPSLDDLKAPPPAKPATPPATPTPNGK